MPFESPADRAYPESMIRLIGEFSKLPGIGRRSAERLAFHVLKAEPAEAERLAAAIADLKRLVRHCEFCWNLADESPCRICADPRREAATVLVVEQPRDLIALEHSGMYRGVYHVLLGRLDPLDGVGPESLTAAALLERVQDPARNARGVPVAEVILGLNPDMEGDGTALHLAAELARVGVRVTRLARGLPTGSLIESASPAILADAISGRQSM
jgi:recombination protein RecR